MAKNEYLLSQEKKMELMQAVEHYAIAMKLAERYGNAHGDMDAANNAWQECKKAADRLNAATALAANQAEDDGLWFDAKTAPEAYLQNALRELAAAIETPNVPHEGPGGASREGPLDAVVGHRVNGGNDGNLGCLGAKSDDKFWGQSGMGTALSDLAVI